MSVTNLNTPDSNEIEEKGPDLRKTGAHPDFWYPLLSSHKAKPGKAVGVTFAGDPIVIVRTESGKLYALEDRCAHR